jgi:hypothetical protein
MSNFDSIKINGTSLRPAPFVNTAYEYNKSGEYVIGGLLIVTLSGSIVSENIQSEVASLNALQTNSDCVTLTIGCSGGSDFLNGSGRIRTISFSPGDQPFSVNYSMVIAIETIGGQPAVEADPAFITNNCLGSNVKFLQSYTEKLSLTGEASAISSNDFSLGFGKSYIKISGEINIASYGRAICGVPNYNATQNAENILKTRANSLLSLNSCNNNILSKYNGWYKWLDTKKLTVNIDGSLTWSFDMYLSQGGSAPFAWIDFDTEDKTDQRTKMTNKVLSGKIRGLSSASVGDYLAHKATANERIANAEKAYNLSLSMIANGSWPGSSVILYGSNLLVPTSPGTPSCYQRISSNIKKSVVAGEVSFSAEFGDISLCQTQGGVGTIDITIDETFSSVRYQEFIIPNKVKPVVQQIAPTTPEKIIITGRGTLNGCKKSDMKTLSACVNTEVSNTYSKLPNSAKLILLGEKKNIGTYSYTITKEYILCDSGYVKGNCTTGTQPIYR